MRHLKAFAEACPHWTVHARARWLDRAMSCLKRNDIKTIFRLMDRSAAARCSRREALNTHSDYFRLCYLKSKYFREAGEGRHYDWRFFKREIPDGQRARALKKLLRGFCQMLRPTGIEPILMHGGLIGWAWNRKLLPWDLDIDLCLFLDDLYALNRMKTALEYDRARFLFDINPNFTDRRSRNRRIEDYREPNKIDARFIDRRTGLYIDVTALTDNCAGCFVTKCPHRYKKTDLMPLQRDRIDGIGISVPRNVRSILENEYGREVLQRTELMGHYFDPRRSLWVRRTRSGR